MELQVIESAEIVEVVELSLEDLAGVGGGFGSYTLL
jgi:hypothetical protein